MAAAWIPGEKQRLEVASSHVYRPGPGELLIRNSAVAINPFDAMQQVMGKNLIDYLPSPAILGNDVSGEVVEVGSDVKHIHVGDRVAALALGMDKRGRQPDEGGFQEFVVVREVLSAKLPEGTAAVSCIEACVLPLALSTAACGLFEREQLALHPPRLDAGERRGDGRALLIWGASTSVGNCAVQLAAAAGYHVVATASPKNWDLVRGLGASDVFDYRSPTVVDDLVRAMNGKRSVGALAIGQGSLSQCIDVVSCLDDGVKFVSQASVDVPGGEFPQNAGALQMVAFVFRFFAAKVAIWLKLKLRGVRSKFIWGSDVVEWDKKDRMLFGYLEEALAAGTFKPSPEPMVIGHGLEDIQKGLDEVLKGVAAKKLVVSLEKIVLLNNVLLLRLLFSPGSLQTLHLPQLQLAQILPAQVDAAELVTHGIRRDVLLGPFLGATALLHCLLEHGLVGFPHASDPKVHPGSHLLHLNSGKLLSAALGADEVHTEMDGGLCLALACRVLGTDGYDVLQSLHVDLVRDLALEKVQEQALGHGVLVGNGAFKGCAGKDDHGPQADGKLLGAELSKLAEALRIQV
ncbi:Dehydrogenase azaJ [Paramyrothecium foliicola]|nr:Dehydrogenase azaJ [Paramyrothecium foliicola]